MKASDTPPNLVVTMPSGAPKARTGHFRRVVRVHPGIQPRHSVITAIAITVILLAFSQATAGTEPTNTVPMTAEVFFSPGGGCTAAVVSELDRAKSNVLVQAYSFTSAAIAKALVDAHKRGVLVRVILDKSNQTDKYSAADFVAHSGIPTLIDSEHAIAHCKVMVIDGGIVITGSFNFTRAAEEHNAENLLVIQSTALAAKYGKNWQEHAEHSKPYEGR